MYYAAPGVGKGFPSFWLKKKLPTFLKKRCTQLTIMCSIPARREGSTFKILQLFVKTAKKLEKDLKSACQLVEITAKLPLLC